VSIIGDVYTSDVLGKPVIDPAGEELGRLTDFSVEIGSMFPRVSGLVLKVGKQKKVLSWQHVSVFNKKVMSADASVQELADFLPESSGMLACKSLLDKQIVDINGAKVVRVNDLKLGEAEGALCLMAVDVGVSGLFRRLGIRKRWESLARLLGYKETTRLISWNFLQPLEPKLGALTLRVPRQHLGSLHPSDIAEIISDVSANERPAIMEHLDIETMAETIHELEPNVQAAIIAEMEPEQAADILETMPPDEAADIMGDLPEETAQELFRRMEKEEAEDVQELLEHEEDTAGGLMTTEYISFAPEMTVSDALREYRLEAPNVEAASLYVLYVLDDEERLLGEISLKDLVLSTPSKPVGEVMKQEFKYISPGEDDKDAAVTISKYNLLALPVVDDERRLLGVITVDDALDLVLPPQSRRRKGRIG